MSSKHDKAREERHKAAGGVRLTMRITQRSDVVLDALASFHRCTRRDVLEGLILGTIKPDAGKVVEAMRLHGLSHPEALVFLEVA